MQKKLKKEYLSLSEFVIKKRESLGFSQEELAEKCSLDVEILKSIEQGFEMFLATTIRQKLAKGLKVDNKEIKLYETTPDFNFSKDRDDEIRELILMNYSNPDFKIKCPICGEELITRVAKLYDLEDNLVLNPKARCSKCPYQLKS